MSIPSASEVGKVRTQRRPVCCVCGALPARTLYANLTDRLFSAGGEWNLVECSNQTCGMLWLDPAPVPEDLPRLYSSYYTHQGELPRRRNMLNQGFRHAEEAYLATKYGYGDVPATGLGRLRAALMYLRPSRRAATDFDVFYLPAQAGGQLLEIGCGSGAMLRRMQQRGWKVQGVDFDPMAVDEARSLGLKVDCGDVLQLSLPTGGFDAVVMSHVIEHVSDPRRLLSECARLLRPGGRLVIVTPNVKAISHRLFGRHWRGLEPPRHLHLFAEAPLRRLCREAGLEIEICHSTTRGTRGFFTASAKLMFAGKSGQASRALAILLWGARLWEIVASTLLLFVSWGGDEIACIARKPLK